MRDAVTEMNSSLVVVLLKERSQRHPIKFTAPEICVSTHEPSLHTSGSCHRSSVQRKTTAAATPTAATATTVASGSMTRLAFRSTKMVGSASTDALAAHSAEARPS